MALVVLERHVLNKLEAVAASPETILACIKYNNPCIKFRKGFAAPAERCATVPFSIRRLRGVFRGVLVKQNRPAGTVNRQRGA